MTLSCRIHPAAEAAGILLGLYKWFVDRSHFVVDETETEYLVLGYGEDDEPDADTDYSVYLEDRTNQDFHELVSFRYDGDPAERNLLDEEFREY